MDVVRAALFDALASGLDLNDAALCIKKHCRPESVLGHPLGGVIHSLCGRVHALLGDGVVYLPLAGFFFAALAGIGGGLILDNFNRERKRKRLGWALFLLGLPAGALCLLLGLP